MIPLPAGVANQAFTDQQTLPETRVLLRRSLADAERALERADWLVEQLADLPRAAVLPDTARLLSEQRRLAERRVSLYRTALNAVEQAIRER